MISALAEMNLDVFLVYLIPTYRITLIKITCAHISFEIKQPDSLSHVDQQKLLPQNALGRFFVGIKPDEKLFCEAK